MAKCAHCGKTILFGGIKADDLKFCNKNCLSHGQLAMAAKQVPEEMVFRLAREIHAGPCPVCGKTRGPVDVHTSHKVASFLVATSWSSTPRISCSTCGVKAKLGATAYSLLLGWWGLPWGLIMTPTQVVKNLVALLSSETTMTPSAQLEQFVRMSMATQAVETNNPGPCEPQDLSF